MARFFRYRPSPALVIASLALFVSLGGVSYGLASGSIDSREIRNNTVRTKDLRNNDIRGKDIRRSTITGSDVGADRLTGADIKESALGEVPSAAAADDAAALGGTAADAIQQESDLLFGAIAPANATPAVVRGRGVTAVTRLLAGVFAVTFDRDITDCTWLATYGQPNNANVNAVWATVRGYGEPNQILVVLRNAAGAQVDGDGFHVQAICP